MKGLKIASLLSIALFLVVGLAWADQAEWMPKGGKTLLLEAAKKKPKDIDLASIATTKKTRQEWGQYFKQLGLLKDLTDKQANTLAIYLAYNMPMAKNELPKNIKNAEWKKILPNQGSVMALDACGACHSPAPVLVFSMTAEQWSNFLEYEHAEQIVPFDLTKKNKQTMAEYLAINMPMADERIPKSLIEAWSSY